MKIVALDTFVTEFPTADWGLFKQLGEFVTYERTTPAQIVSRCQDAETVITNKVVFNKEILDQLPQLKYIGVFATGTNCVDLSYAKAKGIVVTNVPGYSTDSVAQHTFAFILNYASKLSLYSASVANGDWHICPDFSYFNWPLTELKDKVLGLIGYGAIAKKVEEIAKTFDMKVLKAKMPGRSYTDQRTELNDLLKQSDFVSLHCPLTETTEHLINAERLKFMKRTSVLINTGRGPLVDETALFEALENRLIAHACLDVMIKEPPSAENKLQFSKHCTITPHVAWGTNEAKQRLINEAALNLKAFIDGQDRNRV